LYVSSVNAVANFGGTASFNTIWNTIDYPLGSDFVISEVAAYCTGASLVGPILGRHPSIYPPGVAVFGLERWVGTDKQWVTSLSAGGFVQTSATVAPGSTITSSSVVGGDQFENLVTVAFLTSFSTFPAAEWVALNSEGVGYFPSSMFTTLGCNVDFYGEAQDASSATTTWMNADMTSGNRPWSSDASINFGQTGYIRQPTIWTSANFASGVSPAVDSSLIALNGGFHPYCYDGRWTNNDVVPDWNPTLWFGGPGGNGPGCNADPGARFSGSYANLFTGGFATGYECSPGCTTCTGMNCGPPGGGRLCCGYMIDNAGTDCMTSFAPCKIKTADPECRAGFKNGAGTVCCGGSCTQCGGSGCNSALGCCIGPIHNLCSGHMPPCIIDPPPKVP
jgi:hypothetical protein